MLTFHDLDLKNQQIPFPDNVKDVITTAIQESQVSEDRKTITSTLTKNNEQQSKSDLLTKIKKICLGVMNLGFAVIKEDTGAVIDIQKLTTANVFQNVLDTPPTSSQNGEGKLAIKKSDITEEILRLTQINFFNAGSMKQFVSPFLANLPSNQIRVYIPDSPNTGHQTTTCNVIRRIIQLGFTGTMEIVYIVGVKPNDSNGRNSEEIKQQLPELNITVNATTGIITCGSPNGLNHQVTVQFFVFDTTNKSMPTPQWEFGISGGVDIASQNVAQEVCNVKYFLTLQPFQWPAANLLWMGAQSINLGKQALLGEIQYLLTACFYRDISMFTWQYAGAYINQIPNDGRRAAISIINTQCLQAQSRVKFMPVYGLGRGVKPVELEYWELEQTQALANIILGVFNAQLESPVFIMTIDPYNTTTDPWYQSVQNKLPAKYLLRLKTCNWNQLETTLTGLQDGEILVLNMGKVLPMPIFNYFYLEETLLPVFEGKGTSFLMVNSQKPFLQLLQKPGGCENTAVSGYKDFNKASISVYPSNPPHFTVTGGVANRTYQQNNFPQSVHLCINAGNAVVNNKQTTITVNAGTFPGQDFNTIQTYLSQNHYINVNDQIQDKFKALTSADEMEDGGAGIDKTAIYNAMQTACTIAGAGGNQNICQTYRDNIENLSTFINGSISANSLLQQYFQDLGQYFNNEAHDKLLKGLAFAVMAIQAANQQTLSEDQEKITWIKRVKTLIKRLLNYIK
jgi:hypothetical protein